MVLVEGLPCSVARVHVHVHLMDAQEPRLHVPQHLNVNELSSIEVGGVAHDLREVEVQQLSAVV